MGGKVELGNDARHDLIVQAFRVWERKGLETFSEVETPLAHYIVRGNLLCCRVVGSASDDHVVGVGIPVMKSVIQTNDIKLRTYRSPFWRGPAPSGRMNSCRQVVHTIPVVA
jgi:hypothetical protein